MEQNRKKEVINICLNCFIENGLYEITTRSLSKALKLQDAGLYYYFTSKDEVVIQCAEVAARKIENELIAPTIHNLTDPDNMMKRLRLRADKMAPTMRFIAEVDASKRYHEAMKPANDGMMRRYKYYVEKIAKQFGCPVKEIEPYVYITIAAVINYMIFGEVMFAMPQIEVVKDKIYQILQNNKHGNF